VPNKFYSLSWDATGSCDNVKKNDKDLIFVFFGVLASPAKVRA
jgi:hypothetical protein